MLYTNRASVDVVLRCDREEVHGVWLDFLKNVEGFTFRYWWDWFPCRTDFQDVLIVLSELLEMS